MDRVLCLDLATSIGYAHSSGESGIVLLTAVTRARVWKNLRKWLEAIHKRLPFDRVVIEKPHFRGNDATRCLVGLATIVEYFCEEYSLGFSEVHNATLKKHATGNGHANKEKVVAAAIARGWTPVNDDEADALWLLDLTLNS